MNGGVFSNCLILVSARFSESSGTVMASVNTVCSLGCLLGPVVGGVLYDLPSDRAEQFRLPFLVCAAMASSARCAFRGTTSPTTPQSVRGSRRVARTSSLLFMLRCSLDVRAQGINERLQADVQRRDKCQWIVSITTSAACPVNAGPQTTCAPNCPRTWLGDGEYDPGCSNRA